MTGIVDSQRLVSIGYDTCAASCGRFMVVDHDVRESRCSVAGLHVISIQEAIDRHPHIRDRVFFKLVEPTKNEFTQVAAHRSPVGYYVYVEEGVRIHQPLQAAFLFGGSHPDQVIHNIIELGPGSELNIVNGCASASREESGRHIGITETVVGKQAHLGYTMIHNWGPGMEVYPVGAVVVEEGGSFISNYVAMEQAKKVVTFPKATVGRLASARFYSIIYGKPGSFFDTGAMVFLEGEDSTGEIVSRVVSDGGTVISRQMIAGTARGNIGHMECNGLLLDTTGVVHSIPELRGEHPDIDLSHEASIGRISNEELSYLMTRGLSMEQARSLIIRGFLDVKIEGLPPEVRSMVDDVIHRAMSGTI